MYKLLNAILAGLMATFSCNDLCRYGCAAEQRGKYNLDDLLNALIVVESNGDPNAVGDNNEAIGVLQIHTEYVDDVNHILGCPKFSYNDRWDTEKSRQMATVYLRHYGKGKSIEAMARIHNGGPNGWRKENTVGYWKKVKAELEK